MINIKTYENFDSRLYRSITKMEYDKFKHNFYGEKKSLKKISDYEILPIRKLIDESKWKASLSKDGYNLIVYWYSKIKIGNDDVEAFSVIEIHKSSDDYYYVDRDDSDDSNSMDYSGIRNNHNHLYICDQLDGLLNLLTDILD